MRDEIAHQIARELLVVVEAEVRPLRVLRRLHQHQRVAAPVRRQHHAEEARERDERPVGRLFQRDAGVLARPFDRAGKIDRVRHASLLIVPIHISPKSRRPIRTSRCRQPARLIAVHATVMNRHRAANGSTLQNESRPANSRECRQDACIRQTGDPPAQRRHQREDRMNPITRALSLLRLPAPPCSPCQGRTHRPSSCRKR